MKKSFIVKLSSWYAKHGRKQKTKLWRSCGIGLTCCVERLEVFTCARIVNLFLLIVWRLFSESLYRKAFSHLLTFHVPDVLSKNKKKNQRTLTEKGVPTVSTSLLHYFPFYRRLMFSRSRFAANHMNARSIWCVLFPVRFTSSCGARGFPFSFFYFLRDVEGQSRRPLLIEIKHHRDGRCDVLLLGPRSSRRWCIEKHVETSIAMKSKQSLQIRRRVNFASMITLLTKLGAHVHTWKPRKKIQKNWKKQLTVDAGSQK